MLTFTLSSVCVNKYVDFYTWKCKNDKSQLHGVCNRRGIRFIQLRSYTIYFGVDALSFYTCRWKITPTGEELHVEV